VAVQGGRERVAHRPAQHARETRPAASDRHPPPPLACPRDPYPIDGMPRDA
jgi:hypothetical protein